MKKTMAKEYVESILLLQSTTKSIIQIAYAVGFNDLSDFSRQFKKRHRISPSQYRTVDDSMNCAKKKVIKDFIFLR